MLYFEDARVEFFGVPLAYIPFMSTPDPTVKRKSGFLFPSFSQTTQYGYRRSNPNIFGRSRRTPISPVDANLTTKQGAVLEGEWRHRLMDGAYSIKAAGIFQADPGYFAGRDGPDSPTANTFRGAVQTAGQFAINDKWVWGWTGFLSTDSQFMYDYQFQQISGAFDPFQTGIAAEASRSSI